MQAPSYNQRNRSLDAADINAGPKRGTQRQSSYAPPPNYVAGVNKSYNPIPRNEEGRPYKNGSSVFAHLEDNAAANGHHLQSMSLEEMDVYWNEAKKLGL